MTTPTDELDRARALLDTRRWQAAVDALRIVLARTPEDPEPHRLMAQALLGLRQPLAAVTAAQHALALDPASTWSRRLYALALHNAGRHHEAATEGRRLVAQVPDEWRAWWVLSVACRGVGGTSIGESVGAARQAVALAPEHGDTHDALGSALLASGDALGAQESFRRALALDPADAYALNGLGQVDLRRNDAVSAAEGFRRALLADPQEQAARHNLRVVLQQLLQPVTLVIWVCAIVVRITTSTGHDHEVLFRSVAGAAALVASGVLVRSARTTFRHLDPTIRRFYLRLMREDRGLAGGVGLHALALVSLWLIVVLPIAAASGLGVVAFFAALAGRLLVFPRRNLFRRRR
jgi:Flp pilus assembly protein TadD